MTFEQLYQELESLGAEHTKNTYLKHGASSPMFGVSYANLGKLKMKVHSPEGKVGFHQQFAEQLWASGNLDARLLACMIADPATISENTIDSWIKEIDYYALADSFSDLVYSSPFAMKKMLDWTFSDKEYVKRIGYTLLNSFARLNTVFNNGFFEAYITIVENEIHHAPNRAKEGMNNCLIAIGSRNEALKKKIIQSSRKIGKVEIDHGDTGCQTFVIEDYLEKIYARRNMVKQ
ncbi:DNA alkylation repair protein [Cytophagales bacterium LB-30]|uniref:DNA alkylation repair protein n=1 Tax=Shiella aurantiaca TaxID=3058365 RepID=A0ABT8F7B9_9BACT|nr:DNA alkylation repair protein [Shiella aurantiaca]MDN4166372.1 DNA alkylation repair protein [Shiella aurantiaca]